MIGVKDPSIKLIPSNDTAAYNPDKNAFCGLTRKISAIIPIIIGTMTGAQKLSRV